jgi:hypothetical protein
MKYGHRRERELAPLDPRDQVGEAARQPSGVDAPARLVFGQAEPLHAELEHRGTRRLEMEAPLVHLDEMREEAREHRAPLANERPQALEELRVGEIGELHACVLHPSLRCPLAPAGRTIARETLPAVCGERETRDRATCAPERHLSRALASRAVPHPRSRQEKSSRALTGSRSPGHPAAATHSQPRPRGLPAK